MTRYAFICTLMIACAAFFFSGCSGSAQPGEAAKPEAARPLPDIGEIVDRMVSYDGCRDITAEMKMTAVDGEGKKDQIDFKVQRKYAGDRTMTFISVLAPNDETDKAILAIEKPGAETEAFSYLSGLKKLTKLNSGRQLGFHGARVSVQELLGMELNQYTRNEGERVSESGRELIKVAFREKPDRGLAFPRIDGYFSESERAPVRFDLYDQQDRLAKKVRIDEIKTISDRRTITEVAIDDLQQNLKLTLVTRNVSFDSGIPDAIFTENHLIAYVDKASRIIDK